MALVGSADETDLNELWHRRMGHFHHGALRTLQKIVTGVAELTPNRMMSARGAYWGNMPRQHIREATIGPRVCWI